MHIKTDVVDRREGTKLPHEVVNVDDDFVVSRGQRTIERDGRGVFLVGHAAQQRHEAILESRGCWGDARAAKSVVRASSGRGDSGRARGRGGSSRVGRGSTGPAGNSRVGRGGPGGGCPGTIR